MRFNYTLFSKFCRYIIILCVIGTSVIACSDIDKPDNLFLYLSFDDGRGFTPVQQSNTESVFTNGVNNMSLFLSDEAIQPTLHDSVKGLFSNKYDFSLNIWVKSIVLEKDTSLIIGNTIFQAKEAGIYGFRRINSGFSLYSYDGCWGWNLGNGSKHFEYEPVYKDQPLSDNHWHMLTFTYDRQLNEVRLYYDGVNKAIIHIGDIAHQDFISELPLVIGSHSGSNPSYKTFNGSVDELSIWSKSLSMSEVAELYKKYRKPKVMAQLTSDKITVLNWNIWHGATHYTMEEDGFDGIDRTIELIQQSGADIVLMQETYGAGSKISSELGFHYYEAGSCIGAVWGANLSVMSRYPMTNAYMNEAKSNYGSNYAFNNGGVKIKLNDEKSLIVFSNWYNRQKSEDLDGALKGWSQLIDNADSIPVIFAGDYNSISHLDDDKGEPGHSRLMIEAGFTDAYRSYYPDIAKHPGYSFNTSKARIDYIYHKGNKLELMDVTPILPNFKGKGTLTPFYPSDHLGLVARYKIK